MRPCTTEVSLSDVISIDEQHSGGFSAGVVEVLSFKLQLCAAIMIFLVSLAVEIFHPIRLNSLVVVLENQHEDKLHSCGRRRTQHAHRL